MSATTFSGLWDDLKAEAQSILSAVEAEGKKIEAQIVPVIESDVVTILSQFKSLAIQTVLNFASAEFANLTGQEKLGNVVTTVFQAAESAGKAVAISDVQMFAQQAYNAVATTLKPNA